MGPICQKHTFLKNIALVIGLSIGCFRAGISVPLIIAGELCKSGDWATDFYIVGIFTLTVSLLWLIVLRFDSVKRREIEHLVNQESSPPLLKVLGTAMRTVLREYSTYRKTLN